ncbi:MAG: hypothetical protein J7J88_01480 [Dehalococcoidia bacterium]|nr:hypothetical protein [Dehalococcoidia bacterium]
MIAFGLGVVATIIAIVNTRDYHLLTLAIPMLLALLVIPMIFSSLNQQVSSEIDEAHAARLKLEKIQNINMSRIGEPVKVIGTVEKISFRWMNRPLLSIRDNTGTIPVIIFTSFPSDVMVGDKIQVVGMIMRKMLLRGNPAISGMSISKIPDIKER